MSCPWSNFTPGTIQFCEERLCAWVVEPANTWSNVGYLITGLIIAAMCMKQKRSAVNFFSITSIYLFIGSGLFHATATFWGEVLDLSAMFLLALAVLSINLMRWKQWDLRRTYTFFVISFLFSVGLLLAIKPIGIPLFAVQMASGVILEFALWKRAKGTYSLSHLKTALGFFFTAFGFWILDILNIACLPTNHIFTGHSAWHLLNAATIFFVFKHYDPFLLRRAA